MQRPFPEWFTLSEEMTEQVMRRIANSVADLQMSLQVRSAPMQAHWFLLDALSLANQANREGMHANALILTRQCIEAISIIELGICGHSEAEAMLLKWQDDKLSPGKARSWLEKNVWPQYGTGLWTEPWFTFMREFAAAVQPYAHYSRSLAQWQEQLLDVREKTDQPEPSWEGLVVMKPRAYDAQKATRITLFHVILTFTLGRIWVAANPDDSEFAACIDQLRVALSKSRYLDGHQTNWSHQFWAMVWRRSGGTILE